VANDSWSGQLRGLAIYNLELTPTEVSQHENLWMKEGRPERFKSVGAVALYNFEEHAGKIVHNQAGWEPNLYIPQSYEILHEKFLEPPKSSDWSDYKDILVNVAGFVPLGFFFCAYLSWPPGINRPALTTVFLGAIASLTIETLQVYLPLRDSGLTDVITNTLGTGIGVVLYSCNSVQVLLSAFGFPSTRKPQFALVIRSYRPNTK
jgi:VanZ family protein